MIDPNLKQKLNSEIFETNKKVISQTLGFISSAFVLVAALAWNEAIKELIGTYFKSGTGLISKLSYAVIVTIIAVIVTSRLTKISQGDKSS